MRQVTFTAPSGEIIDFMEAKLAEFKAEFPQIKRNILAGALNYGETKRGVDRRPAAYQIARNLSEQITELEEALREAREIEARTPSVRAIPVTLPVHKPADGYVYFAVRKADGAIKIGYSKNPDDRLKGFMAGSGPCVLVAEKPGSRVNETELHRQFADSRIGGEWFKATPELLALIRKWPLL